MVKFQKGLMLEILLIVILVAVLAGIAFLAINPGKTPQIMERLFSLA